MMIPKRGVLRLTPAQLTKFYAKIDDRDLNRDQRTGELLAVAEHHHRQYRSRGGSDVASNVITLRGPGNTQGSHGWAHTSREAILFGYSIPSFVENPEDVPIKLLHPENGLVWTILRNDFSSGFMTERDARHRMRDLGIWRDGEAA
ncbi:hypothetical protein MN032_10875 [Agromyces atrinae]|uniref:hypothetical protein n=1 Tax=Agromyces atrinae TaxID=592376 RepID=UPI001F589824|nr:hypothetical protein [Agromyces atrinae]MCI2958200.1 hypothetical protein [Agromyces atrinae]